ncbi:MAG: LPS O-antigen subunit length determinant protein (WzzB/FepE family) [Phenylobacterium sp.]
MKYPEYLSSAKRHNQACRVLKEKLESYESDNSQDEKFNNLIISLYYLSGYIIECSLKFKIFEVFSYNSNIEIDKDECKALGLNYNSQVKTHNFQTLQNLLDSKISDVSHISNQRVINRLSGQWGPEIRYEHRELQYQDVRAFYDHANRFLKEM